MDTEYIEATSQSRRRIVFIFLFALILGIVLIQGLEELLGQTKTHPICEQIVMFRWLWAGVCLSLVILCVWVAWLAQRSLKLNQWPPPGTLVFRRTPIHRGSSAKWRAYVLLGSSVVVLAGSTWSWHAGESLVARVASQRCAER